MNLNQGREGLSDELLKNLIGLDAAQLEALSQTRETHAVMGLLLQQESQRLAQKLGATNQRVQQMNAGFAQNLATIQVLETELEIARIQPPQVDETSALVQGRILDERYQGLSELTVFLGNEQKTPIRSLSSAVSDRSGYYALQANESALAELSRLAPNGVFLTVCTRKGTVLYQSAEPLLLKAGDRLIRDVALSRIDLCPIDGKASPAVDGLVRGQIINAAGQGISGLKVSAIDANRRYDDILGAALTNDRGEFKITYRYPDADSGQTGLDLYITIISAKGQQLYSSQPDLRRNASRDEQFAITLQETPTERPLDGSLIWFQEKSLELRKDTEIDAEALLALAIKRVRDVLAQQRQAQVVLTGYTSAAGNADENLKLSQARAELIQERLVKARIPKAKLTIVAAGGDATYPNPLDNERVEIGSPDS